MSHACDQSGFNSLADSEIFSSVNGIDTCLSGISNAIQMQLMMLFKTPDCEAMALEADAFAYRAFGLAL